MYEMYVSKIRPQIRVRNRKLFFLFLNQNICCGPYVGLTPGKAGSSCLNNFRPIFYPYFLHCITSCHHKFNVKLIKMNFIYFSTLKSHGKYHLSNILPVKWIPWLYKIEYPSEKDHNYVANVPIIVAWQLQSITENAYLSVCFSSVPNTLSTYFQVLVSK